MGAQLRTTRVLLNTSTGNQDITISGFGTPTAAMFYYDIGETDDTIRSSARLSEGYTDGTNEAVVGGFAQDAQSTSSTRRVHRNNAVLAGVGSGSDSARANFVSWITDGVRINVSIAPSTARYLVVVLVPSSGVLNTHVETRQLTSTSTVLTTVGFEPSVVFSSSVGLSALSGTNSSGNLIISSGVAANDGADTNIGSLNFDQDGQTTTNTGQYRSDTESVGQFFNNSLTWAGDINTYTSTGFTITTTANGNDYISFLAIEFDSDTQFKLVAADSPTSTGAKSFTGAGFTPTFSLTLAGNASAVNTNTAGLNYSIFTADATNQFSNSITSLDAQSTSICKSISKSGGLTLLSGNSKEFDSTFTGFNSDGQELNFSAVDATARKWNILYIGDVGAPPATTIPVIMNQLRNQGIA